MMVQEEGVEVIASMQVTRMGGLRATLVEFAEGIGAVRGHAELLAAVHSLTHDLLEEMDPSLTREIFGAELREVRAFAESLARFAAFLQGGRDV